MKFFSKPVITKCEFQKLFVTNSSLIRLRIAIAGWGEIYIDSIDHPEWKGVKRKFWGAKITTFLVPKNSIIKVKCSNLLGSTVQCYRSPNNNNKLSIVRPPAPPAIEFNSLPEPFFIRAPLISLNASNGLVFEPKIIEDTKLRISLELNKMPEPSIEHHLLKPVYPESLIKF